MDREKLKAVIPEERLVFDSIAPEYLSDTLGRRKGKAEALVFPLSAEEVSGVLKFAHENRIPVTPRGAGINLVGSTVPTEGGIILDLSRMNRILELDPATMTVTVEPGVAFKGSAGICRGAGAFLPAGSRREGFLHRRQHQHQRRRDAGREIRRHKRLCPGA